MRRNKLVFGAAAALTLALVLGVAASSWEAVQARRAERDQIKLRQQAQAAQLNEAHQRQKAQAEAARSSQTARLLTSMLAGVGPSVARGRDTTMLREILDRAVEQVQQELQGQPEVQADLNSTLAGVYTQLSEFERAELVQERAVEQYRAALGNESCKLAGALGALGELQSELRKVELGKVTAQAGLDMARRCGDKKTVASCLLSLARAIDPGRMAEAAPLIREAAAIQTDLGNDPAALGSTLRRLAYGRTNPQETERLFRQALALHRQALGEDHPEVVSDLIALASCLWTQGKSDDAEAAGWDAVNLGRKLFKNNHVDLGFPVDFLSNVLITRGKWGRAESLIRQALADAPQSAEAWGRLGQLEARRQAWSAAVEDYARSAELDPGGSWLGGVAIGLLESGRVQEYRQHCHSMLERFAATGNFGQADRAAKDSLLLPVAGADFERACQLADFAGSAVAEPRWVLRWYALCKALADYRRGWLQSASDWSARAAFGDASDPHCQAAGLFLQAMVFARLGNVDLAHAALSAGNTLFATNHTHPPDLGEWPCDWAVADLLCREAQGLIAHTGVADSKPR